MSVSLLRVIARLNVGGPAIQAITLSARLAEHGYSTTLVRGNEAEREGSMDGLAAQWGVSPVHLAHMSREISPIADLRAAVSLRAIIRRLRPQVLHTHTAKAGTVGRVAALLAGRRRPRLIVHTFHGHVLSGYFSAHKARLFTAIERFLARYTDVLIAVSEEVKADLVALRIAPAERITVIHLGLPLARFLDDQSSRAASTALRARIGVPEGSPLVSIVARLVPIKRVDIFLRAAQKVIDSHPSVRFCVAGDGELMEQLRSDPSAAALGERIVWPGFVEETEALYSASDVVVLCSDNEGTPVSLIEALASKRPVVSTNVGGVETVVRDMATGLLVPPGDAAALATAIVRLLDEPELADRLASAGREHVRDAFSLDRLVADIVKIYDDPS